MIGILIIYLMVNSFILGRYTMEEYGNGYKTKNIVMYLLLLCFGLLIYLMLASIYFYFDRQEKKLLKLSDEDMKIFNQAMNNPPEPNEKLKEAFKVYKDNE